MDRGHTIQVPFSFRGRSALTYFLAFPNRRRKKE